MEILSVVLLMWSSRVKKQEWYNGSDLPSLELFCLSDICLLGNGGDKRTEDSWELLNSKLIMESCI